MKRPEKSGSGSHEIKGMKEKNILGETGEAKVLQEPYTWDGIYKEIDKAGNRQKCAVVNYDRIQMVALDLDDTTLRPDGSLSERTRRAIMSAVQNGIEIVIASGRAFGSLPDELLVLEGIRYAITSNGVSVNDVPSGRRLFSCGLPENSVEQILKAARGEHVMLEAFLDGIPYTERDYVEHPQDWGCAPRSVHYVSSTRRPVDDIEAFILEHKGELDCIDFVCGNLENKLRLMKKVQEHVEGIYATTSVPHLLEISAAGCGKENGLRVICGLTGILPEQTAACGNADNDAGMLQMVGIGAAVEDATPHCLAAADVIIGSNREDGVAVFLEEIVKAQRI